MCLGPTAYTTLANLLNEIEAGLPWPTATNQAKAAFLSKHPTPSTDPLGYRVLLILPVVYRRWANARLYDLREWVDQWFPEGSMFAGAPGLGADDAWMSTAIWAEQCTLNHLDFGGGSTDVFKCFDQIRRPLLYSLLQHGGFPPPHPSGISAFHGLPSCS